jgi:hypothetical protein
VRDRGRVLNEPTWDLPKVRPNDVFAEMYRDWLAIAFLEKVSDPSGAKHPKGRSGHWGQTPFPQYRPCRGMIIARRSSDSLRDDSQDACDNFDYVLSPYRNGCQINRVGVSP